MTERTAPSDRNPSTRVMIVIQNVSFTYDTRIQKVATSLLRAGYEVLIISPRYKGDPRSVKSGGIESWHYPNPAIAVGMFGHVIEFIYSFLLIGMYSIAGLLLRRSKVVHFCSPPDILFPWQGLFRLLRRYIIVDVHDLSPELAKVRYNISDTSVLARFLRMSEKATSQLSSHVITTTRTQRDTLVSRCRIASRNVSIVPNGIDLDALPRASAARVTDQPTVGYIGTMNKQDGVESLLESIRYIDKGLKRKDIHFLLIGDGDSYQTLMDYALKLEILDVVTFTGRLLPEEAMAMLERCDVCVQPDQKNEFNDSCCMVKTLEYMSLGKPIVAFDLVETRRCCGDAIVYAKTGSPVCMADAVVDLIDNPKRREQLGRKARLRLERAHTWQLSERVMLEVYSRATNGNIGNVTLEKR